LGNGLLQPIIKDYNGQTYWYSIDINQLVGKPILPPWLLLTFGVGANGLLGGHDNIWTAKNGEIMDYSSIPRTTHFLISIDLNSNYLLEKYPKAKKALFFLRMIKFPAPALEINFAQGIKFHPIFF
ncbi:MAG: hypothetical protein K2Q22_17920, partial [Cytophagales bacterium]|nr:hypothetical protein [Cytophagales bacterium]